MNFKRSRQRHRAPENQLRVEQVILPQQKEQNSTGSNESGRRLYEHCEHRSKDNISNTVKLGEHEISAFCGFTGLEEPPLETFFQGTKKKKCNKKKRKLKRPNCFSDDSLRAANEAIQTNETETNACSTNERLKEQYITNKILKYKKQMEEEQKRNYLKQRLLEEEAMQKQENLAETWLGYLQRREQLKKKDLEENFQTFQRRRYLYHRPVNISILPKKYWKDERDENSTKPQKRSENQGEKLITNLEELETEFNGKLVFVDSDD